MSIRKPSRPISPLYARYLTAEEKQALRAVPVNDLSSELKLMHMVFAHFMKFQQSAPKDIDSQTQNLRTSYILGEQFAKLVRVQIKEHDPLGEIYDVMEQAWEEIRKEMDNV